MITVTYYDQSTGESVLTYQTDLPIEMAIVPDYATTDSLPKMQPGKALCRRLPDGTVPVRGDTEGAKWLPVVDWRGAPLFSISDGSTVSIGEIGQTPADVGATEVPPPGADYSWDGDAWVIDVSKVAARLVSAKSSASARICTIIAAQRSALAAPADAAEIAGWPNKSRIARAVLGNTAAAGEVEVLRAEIDVRAVAGETLEQFAQRIIDKSDAFSKASGKLDGLKRQLLGKVADAKTIAEVEAVLAGLPAGN